MFLHFQIRLYRDSKKNTTEEENEIREVSNEYTKVKDVVMSLASNCVCFIPLFLRLSTEPKLTVSLQTWIYLMSLLMLLWTLMKAQSHSLPLREAEGEPAGRGVAGEGGKVSYHVLCHKYEGEIDVQREIHSAQTR